MQLEKNLLLCDVSNVRWYKRQLTDDRFIPLHPSTFLVLHLRSVILGIQLLLLHPLDHLRGGQPLYSLFERTRQTLVPKP